MSQRSTFHANSFPTTRWSQVMVAREDHSAAHSALNDLCRKYWRPIYAFARHRGCAPHDAEDMTQAYFAKLLERDYIQRANQERGRFRAFLIHDFKFFLSNHQGRLQAEKRGGQASFIALDVAWAESRHEPIDPTNVDADAYFDRQWALEIVRHAKAEVAADYEEQGKQTLFDALQSGLVSSPDAALYGAWEQKLGMSVNALKTALSRLRDRFRAALEAQILETVANEDDLKAEMRHLRRALSQSQSGA
jgi:DNA-directed RNA polymerase specialized sigma24 family protein